MRGIILAMNDYDISRCKYQLPVGKYPMIVHSLKLFRRNGIEDVTIVSSSNGISKIVETVGDGRLFHLHMSISYKVCDCPYGDASALRIAERRGDNSTCHVMHADNIFLCTSDIVLMPKEDWARCFIYRVEDKQKRQQLHVARFNGAGTHIDCVLDHPKEPPSEFVVTEIYSFGPGIWFALQNMQNNKPMKLSDLLTRYGEAGRLSHTEINGFWGIANTWERLRECNEADWNFGEFNAIGDGRGTWRTIPKQS